ncbi:MAG TPA: alpha/beta hydrolase-fold protein [Kofleriaceae bacterium]|nr:alpha/beta hydrolase-fold protein [Kofleriaceae bacterium]
MQIRRLPRANVVVRNILALAAVAGCHSSSHDEAAPDAAMSQPDASTACASGLAGAPCVLDLYDRATAACDPTLLAQLHTELDARAGLGPMWAAGRALFRTSAPATIAGDWQSWNATDPTTTTAPVCATDLVVVVTPVPTGLHTYKLATNAGATWSLDPGNPAFAFDGFAGNPDGRNSVLNTPDSGRGHLVELADACSTTLGNCRHVTAYLPAAYDAPASAALTYPVLFMHDGQNVWDDPSCCFGNGGWQVNVTLDSEIAGGTVKPIVVVAADNTTNRNNEYGLDATTTAEFEQFQVTQLQPQALGEVRGDGGRVYLAGSSLGGLVSMEIALAHADVYAGVASLSGSFWVGTDNGTALVDQVPSIGKLPLAVYLDSGGATADDSDSAQDTVNLRDALVTLGWQLAVSPACTAGDDALCYYLAPGATHDEAAWRARAWRFLRFLFAP